MSVVVHSDYLIDQNQQTESDFINNVLSFPKTNKWCHQWRNIDVGSYSSGVGGGSGFHGVGVGETNL